MTDSSDAAAPDAVMEFAAESTAPLNIEGLSEPVILHYFNAMNAGDYSTAASLFAADGVLNPPFETGIAGQDAIVAYLLQEAKGMLLQPRQGVTQAIDPDSREITVTGKVQTSLFGVNVNWIFILNPASQITSARIKLIASPQELLNLKR